MLTSGEINNLLLPPFLKFVIKILNCFFPILNDGLVKTFLKEHVLTLNFSKVQHSNFKRFFKIKNEKEKIFFVFNKVQ